MNDNPDAGLHPDTGRRPEDAEYDPPLVTLPGAKVSPEVLLHRTLNKVGRIKNVVVVIQWDDNTVDVDWSTMMQSELCMAEKVLSMAVAERLTSDG